AVPHAQWDVRSFYPSLRILLGSRENADLYLRIESNRVLNFPASIMDRSEFRQRDRARTTISGLMIGVFLALLSLACILLFVERNSAFTLYCLYLLFLAAGLAAMMGNGIQFFASVEPQILSRIGIMAFPAARAILLLMIPFFCGRPIAGNQIIIRIAGIEMICGLVLAAGGWTISAQISTAIAFLSTILEIGALAASLRAAATLPAWLWLIAAGARIPAYVFEFGYLPYSTAVVYFWIFLIPLDFLILADRIRMLRTEKSRYAKSRITGLDVSSIVTKMEKILTIDQLLRDPTLRLPDLARALDIPAYQLSEILNNVVQKSFREYINGLRIQTAQRSFTVDPDADIDTVMRENGFRSRSVFNHAFKSQTGQTPVEFKRSSQK
ncbi:MAG TPA: helix-turn-helix domain-containing protein, partial [Leptospiraceae bacterium]|nr:helix-turn-helix domain-containing protein [Leptospiraceae bacterium]